MNEQTEGMSFEAWLLMVAAVVVGVPALWLGLLTLSLYHPVGTWVAVGAVVLPLVLWLRHWSDHDPKRR